MMFAVVITFGIGRGQSREGFCRMRLYPLISLQCFDTVGWATGRASGLQKTGCWFVGGDDLTGALHDL